MNFKVSLDIDIKLVNDVWYINGIEVDEQTLSFLSFHKVKLDLIAKQENKNISFNLSPEIISYLRNKFYKN